MSHGPHLREMSIYHFFHLHTTKAATVEARKRDEKACLAPTAVSFFSPSILPSRFTTRSLSPLSQKYSTCRSSFDGSTEKLQLNFNMQCAYSLTFYWAQQSLSESLWPCRYSDQGRVLRKQNMHCFLTTPNTIYLSSPRLLEKVACQSNEYIHHALNGATFERTVLFWIVFFCYFILVLEYKSGFILKRESCVESVGWQRTTAGLWAWAALLAWQERLCTAHKFKASYGEWWLKYARHWQAGVFCIVIIRIEYTNTIDDWQWKSCKHVHIYDCLSVDKRTKFN